MRMDLERFFEDQEPVVDSAKGLTRSPGGGRVSTLNSSNLLALKMVASQFGEERQFFQRWGSIQAGLILDEWNSRLLRIEGCHVDALPVVDFLQIFSRHFARLGWGRFSFDVSPLPTMGYLRAGLRDSIFVEVFEEPFCDWSPVGLLGEMFGILSGQRLRSVQVGCPSTGEAESLFVISDAERIRALEKLPARERTYCKTF